MAQMKEAGKKLKEMMLADDYLAEKFRSDDESHTDIHVVSYLEWSRNAAWRERGLIFDGQVTGYRLEDLQSTGLKCSATVPLRHSFIIFFVYFIARPIARLRSLTKIRLEAEADRSDHIVMQFDLRRSCL